MNTLLLYDSLYGNTSIIAQEIAGALEGAKLLRVPNAKKDNVEGIDFLIVGSPTQGGRPTPILQEFIDSIPDQALQGIKVAAFDTRFLEADLSFGLKLLVRTIGYAAPKIAKSLERKGAILVAPPEGFIVKGKEGPLAPDERERAAAWARQISSSAVKKM